MAILLATDFSPEAAEAERIAAALARVWQTTVAIVHVLEPGTTFPLTSGRDSRNLEAARERAARELMERARAQLEAAGVEASSTVLRGDVVSALEEEVLFQPPTLVVVGGGGPDGKASYRGLAEDIAQALPCPVVVARAGTDALCNALSGKARLRVLAAIDQTQSSEPVIDWLRALREHVACDIEVAHYFWPPREYERLGIDPHGEPYAVDGALAATLEREIRARLRGLAGTGELTVVCRPYLGSIGNEVCDAARQAHAHLIAVGNHHRTRFGRMMRMSVSASILRYSDTPVVCIGAGRQRARRPRPFHNILVATDLSDRCNAAIAQAYEMLADHRGTITLLHVVSGPLDRAEQRPRRLDTLALETLTSRLRSLVPEYVDDTMITTRFVIEDGGPVTSRILQVAEREGVDAIVLGSSGSSRLDRVMTGSVASTIVAEARKPVVVHRSPPL